MVKWTIRLLRYAKITKFLVKLYKEIFNFFLSWIFKSAFYYYYKYSNLKCQNDTFNHKSSLKVRSETKCLNLVSGFNFMILNVLNMNFFLYSINSY
jgi:hypothetical protein